jgi:hypothetical protein
MAIAQPGGLLYGPTVGLRLYLSVYYHRSAGNAHKSLWLPAFAPDDEYALFETCETSKWMCPDGHFWGVHGGGQTILGTRRERLSFCPKPQNESDAWHGYPFRSDGVKMVPEDVVSLWEDNGIIDDLTARRIRGGKI